MIISFILLGVWKMSITVYDIMQLPSLRDAKVAAGHEGMQRSIASISVLESTDTDILKGLFYPGDEFIGSEIVITGFMNCADNVDLQCELIRCLAEGGEIGIILYYVGVCIPEISERVINLCDELDFVLIVMPEGSLKFRYSEVITEVMEAIINDRSNNTHFSGELLMELSRLPGHQKSVDTMMKMISDRLQISLFLYSGGRLLNSATWPRNNEERIIPCLAGIHDECIRVNNDPDCWGSRVSIKGEEKEMDLLIYKEGLINKDIIDEIREAVQLVINIWNTSHDHIAVEELIKAILQDEPIKMRSLARIYQIDVESISSIWMIGNEHGANISKKTINEIKEFMYPYFNTLVIGEYNGCLVVFTEEVNDRREKQRIENEIISLLENEQEEYVLVCVGNLQSTTDTSESFVQFQKYLKDAKKVYPGKRILRPQELEFIKACREKISQGTLEIRKIMEPLYQIQEKSDEADLVSTLEIFLLDGDCSYLKTSTKMFLHNNTIKYRIKKCSDILGFHIGDMPDTINIYQAAAIRRILT